jgi:hypothetical protein
VADCCERINEHLGLIKGEEFIDFKLLKISSAAWSELVYLLAYYITSVVIMLTVTSTSIALLFNSNVPWTGISFSCTKSPWKEISAEVCTAETWVYIRTFLSNFFIHSDVKSNGVDETRMTACKTLYLNGIPFYGSFCVTEPAQRRYRLYSQRAWSDCRKDAG